MGLVQGCTIPVWVLGALFSSITGAAEAAPLEGGPRGQHIPEARRWGCPGGKRFLNPCLCAVTPHVLGYSTSPPSRSASGVCNACWLRLAAARQALPGKNNSMLLQTSTSRSLAQPPWVTEPLLVLEPAGPGSTGMDPIYSTSSEPRLAPSATPPRAEGAGTGAAWPWPSHHFPCWMLNWPWARARWWKPVST